MYLKMDITISPKLAEEARASACKRLEHLRTASAIAMALKPFAGKYLTKRVLPDIDAAARAACPALSTVYISTAYSSLISVNCIPGHNYQDTYEIPMVSRIKDPGARRIDLEQIETYIRTNDEEAAALTAALATFDQDCAQWNAAMTYAATLYPAIYRVLSGCSGYEADRIRRM